LSTTVPGEKPGPVTKASPRSVADTVARLVELLESKGLTLFATIDQRAEAAGVGLDLRETVVVMFGSPSAGTPVMEHSPLSALDLPLKVVIWDDVGQTRVSYVAPVELMARYDLPSRFGENLAGINALTDVLVAP
jgi:uncharacterized protein (DUF302 family)